MSEENPEHERFLESLWQAEEGPPDLETRNKWRTKGCDWVLVRAGVIVLVLILLYLVFVAPLNKAMQPIRAQIDRIIERLDEMPAD